MNVNPSESTHFRVIQSAPAEEFGSVSLSPALGQADTAAPDETEPQPEPAEINQPEPESAGAVAAPLPANEDIKQAASCLAQPVSKTDSPFKKKGRAFASTVYVHDFACRSQYDKIFCTQPH